MKEYTFLDNPHLDSKDMTTRTVLVVLIASYASFAVTAMTIPSMVHVLSSRSETGTTKGLG